MFLILHGFKQNYCWSFNIGTFYAWKILSQAKCCFEINEIIIWSSYFVFIKFRKIQKFENVGLLLMLDSSFFLSGANAEVDFIAEYVIEF